MLIRLWKVGLALLFLVLLGLFISNLSPIEERLGWRLAELRAQIKYTLSPPGEAVFIPQEQGGIQKTPLLSPTSNPSITPMPTGGMQPVTSPTPFPSLTPTFSPTPLPERVILNGVAHEYQTWNNCGPANLLMALSYWDWKRTQQEIADFTKPNPRDKNIMPYELVAFVEENTELEVIFRAGGDLQLIKAFLAAGFPVILEKGVEGSGFARCSLLSLI
jgi:hypothetical protein